MKRWHEKDNQKVSTRLLKMSDAKFAKLKEKAFTKAMSKKKPHEKTDYSKPIGTTGIRIYF